MNAKVRRQRRTMIVTCLTLVTVLLLFLAPPAGADGCTGTGGYGFGAVLYGILGAAFNAPLFAAAGAAFAGLALMYPKSRVAQTGGPCTDSGYGGGGGGAF